MPLQVKTLGCRLNQAESDGIVHLASQKGFSPSGKIVIVNSCTVTAQADARLRSLIRSTHRSDPDAAIFLTGCLPWKEEKINNLKKLPGVRGIISNEYKSDIINIIDNFLKNCGDSESDFCLLPLHGNRNFFIKKPFDYGNAAPAQRVRALLKIQDGCDRRCTFCAVPFSRGRAVSRDPADIIKHFDYLLDAGIPEIVITGVNAGAYRGISGSGETTDIAGLLEMLLGRIEKKSSKTRIRLSSIEPNHADRKLASVTLHPSFCNYLHIPVQSASEKVLRRMKRPYSKSTMMRNIDACREVNPDLFIGTDIMTGFPGETDADFEQTAEFLRSTGFAKIHVFRYSPRDFTEASYLRSSVPPEIQRKRSEIIAGIEKENFRRFAGERTGLLRTAVTESSGNGEFTGLTDDYLEVTASYDDSTGSPARGSFQKVRITGIEEHGRVRAELINSI